MKVFDVRTGEQLSTLGGLEQTVVQVSFSRDGGRVAASTRFNRKNMLREARVWEAATGEALAEFRAAAASLKTALHGAVALSPDGRLVAFDDYPEKELLTDDAKAKPTVRIHEVASGREVLALPGTGGVVTCLTFSADGRMMAAGHRPGLVRVWDTAEGKLLVDGRMEAMVFSLAFNPEGTRLAGVNREAVELWDVGTGKNILGLRCLPPQPSDGGCNATLAWDADGRWLAASNWDGSIGVWDGGAADGAEWAGRWRQVPPARLYHWHLAQAEAALKDRQPPTAAFHLDRLYGDPPDLGARYRRAALYLRRGDWSRAGTDYAAVFAVHEPDDAGAWLNQARVFLLRRQHDDYRRLVRRMIEHFGEKSEIIDPEYNETWIGVLAPALPAEAAEILRLAEKVAKRHPGHPRALLALALAQYRAGQWKNALAAAEQARELPPGWAWLRWPVLAMIHDRLDHAEEARRWVKQGEEWQRKEESRLAAESFGFAPSEDWADFLILQNEAAAQVSDASRKRR